MIRVLLAALLGLAACQAPVGLPGRAAPGAPRVSLEGVTLHAAGRQRAAARLELDQLVVVPKRLGPIELPAFDEVVVAGARLELFEPALEEQGGRGWGHLGVGRTILGGVDQARPVAGVQVHRLEITLLGADGPLGHLSAARGQVDGRRGDLVLRDVVIEQRPAGRVLRAQRAIWREGRRDLAIPGAWVLEEGGRTTRGHGLVADLALRSLEPSRR